MAGNLSLCWHEHHSTLVSLLQMFLGNDSLVDCTLAAEGKYLKAHKVVLSACSPYFQLLFNQENEKNPIVILKDVQYECLKLVIDFVYHGEVQVRETQLSTFLEVARSLQIKGLDSRHTEATQKRSQSIHSKTNGSASKSIECGTSSQVIDDDSDCHVVQVLSRSDKTSLPKHPHVPTQSQPECVKTITIESTYSIAPGTNPIPALDDSVTAEAVEWPLCSAPSSVASSVSNSAVSVQLNDMQETNSLKCDSVYENCLDKGNGSTEPESETPNDGAQSIAHCVSSGTNGQMEERENTNSITASCEVDRNNSSGRQRKQCSSSVPARRSVLDRFEHGQKLHRRFPKLQLSEREATTLPGRGTTSEKTKETAQASSKVTLEVPVESSKENETTTPRTRIDPGGALSRVLSVVLSKAKLPRTALVSDNEPPAERSLKGSGSKTSQVKRKSLKKHTCPECHKQFLRPSYLTIHRRKHTGEKPHRCPLCNKCFAQPGALRRHGRVHTGERPYVCDYCHKTFNRSGSLKIHKRLHTGERPYQCPECGKTFVARSQLWSHKRVHMEGNYKCDACGKRFKRKPLLAQHWFLVHDSIEEMNSAVSSRQSSRDV